MDDLFYLQDVKIITTKKLVVDAYAFGPGNTLKEVITQLRHVIWSLAG